MASRRELVLDAVKALVEAAYPGADVRRMGPDEAKPNRIPDGGLAIVRRGDPGEPDVLMSPLSYTYDHEVPVELAFYPSGTQTADQRLDEIGQAVDAVIAADRTLGGLCEFVEPRALEPDDAETGGVEAFSWATLTLVCTYTTTSPLA